MRRRSPDDGSCARAGSALLGASSPRSVSPALSPRWTEDELEAGRQAALANFRTERMQEPLEAYLEAFDTYRANVENLLELTVDLSQLTDAAVEVLTNPALLEAVRYLAGPPISADDLKVLSEATLSPGRLQQDPTMARRVVETVLLGLDRNRFPWVAEDREPTEAEREAAAMASAALIASRRVMTDRANESKTAQENAVKARLREAGLVEVPARTIATLMDAPAPGEFCGEVLVCRSEGGHCGETVGRSCYAHRMQGEQLISQLGKAPQQRRRGQGKPVAPRLWQRPDRAGRRARRRVQAAQPGGCANAWDYSFWAHE